MPRVEIHDLEKSAALVELGADPLPLGFDKRGKSAWGPGQVTTKVGEIHGDILRTGDGERQLVPGEAVEVAGMQIVFRGPASDDHQVMADGLRELGKVLETTVASADDLLDRFLASLERALDIKRAAVALLDDDARLSVRASRGEGLELVESITAAALDSGVGILTAPPPHEERPRDVRSVLCVPLRHENEALGVIYADDEGRPGPFTNKELEFVSGLSPVAAFALWNLTQTTRLREENIILKRRLGGSIVHSSPVMEEIQAKVEKVAGFDATVLITGESGVGKEMVAREIHGLSRRNEGPFVAVNCAAIPDTLLESELFGYAPHSGISGADPKGRAGKFEQSNDGTIFLDEIGELKPELQAKLLRVLEDKKVDRLNDTVSRDIDVRILVATNQRLQELVSDGRFREDLYYRLKVVELEVPPLRRRREDVALLSEFFIRTYTGPEQLRKVKLSKAASRALRAYDWPGNVRELKNCMEQALILGDGKTIRLTDLPDPVRAARNEVPEELSSISEVEKDHIARVLAATGWNKAKSARVLGISKPTLYEKIRVYELKPE